MWPQQLPCADSPQQPMAELPHTELGLLLGCWPLPSLVTPSLSAYRLGQAFKRAAFAFAWQHEERQRIRFQGKMLETGECGVGLQCTRGWVQWQLSVRQGLQRLAEWLLWVRLCCRSLRKFTDVFSYETPLQRLKYPVAPSISLSSLISLFFYLSCSISLFPVLPFLCGRQMWNPFFFLLFFSCRLSREHEKLDNLFTLTCLRSSQK